MRKYLYRGLCILLSIALLAVLPGCSSAGYTVTGKIEEGKLDVWLSPTMTQMYNGKDGYIPLAMADGTDFTQDVNIVTFSTSEEFRQSLSQSIMKNEAPDVIIALQEEVPAKLVQSDMFTNLYPFFDYAYKTGALNKEDIMTQIVDGFSFDGKLYAVPLQFSINAITVKPDKDKNEGLNLLAQPNITFNDYMKQLNQWIKTHDEDDFYKVSSLLPDLQHKWKNFIDYKNGTTRMNEDQIYKYFCNKVHELSTFTDIVNQYSKITGTVYKRVSKFEEAVNNWYDSSCIYKLSYLGSDASPDAKQNPNKGYDYLPFITENGTGYIGNAAALAMVPANSDKKEKAFAYISAAFNPNVLENSVAFTHWPMVKSVIKADIDEIQYLNKAEKDELYTKVTESNYICAWLDSQIDEWFRQYNGADPVDRDKHNHIVPTREQWDALKKKIELYLGE